VEDSSLSDFDIFLFIESTLSPSLPNAALCRPAEPADFDLDEAVDFDAALAEGFPEFLLEVRETSSFRELSLLPSSCGLVNFSSVFSFSFSDFSEESAELDPDELLWSSPFMTTS
jgi:hypothetical protein